MMNCFESWPGWLRQGWDALLLLALGWWIFFAHLDSPLLEPDEARYAEIPRLMLRSGDWITPKLQGKPYNDKPPLVYWLIASSYAVFGISIEAARWVPAMAGWLTLLVVYVWSRRYLGRSAANYTALIMLSMLGYVALMRMLLLDGVLTFFIVGSLLAGHHSLTERRHAGWWMISAIFCGLGVLTKGPVAIALVTPCLFALRWLDRNATPMRFVDAIWYGIIVLALAAPWYATMMLTNEGFGSEHFLRHHLQRFLEPAHHERPMWYYLPALFLELMPWPILLFCVMHRIRQWTGTERFLFFFASLCFVFFSIARAKLPTYLLPMFPIVAMLMGRQMHVLISNANSRWIWPVAIMMGSLIITGIVTLRAIGISVALLEGHFEVDRPIALVCVIMLAAMLLLLLRRYIRNSYSWQLEWSAACLFALLATVSLTHRAIPDFAQKFSVVPSCQQMLMKAEHDGIPFTAHRNSWDAVSFQLNREELEVYSSKEISGLVTWIMQYPRSMIWMREGDKRIAGFLKSLPPQLEVEQIYDLGRIQAIILKHAEVIPAEYRTER